MHKQFFSFQSILIALEITFSKNFYLLDPKIDLVFKAIFTGTEKGKIALMGFLNAVLNWTFWSKPRTIS